MIHRYKLIANHKKLNLFQKRLILILCYWNYSINKITDVITDYFKNDRTQNY